MSHDQKRASDWTRQDPVAEQLVVRDFTRPSFSGGLKGVACETRMHVAATLVSQTTPLNIDWGCGLRTRMNMRMRVRTCAQSL